MSKYFGLLNTLFFRGAGALFSVLAIYLVLNTTNQKNASEYFVVLNVITFLTMICSLGFGSFLTRVISISKSKIDVKRYSIGVFYRAASFLLLFFFLYYLAKDEVAEYFDKPVISQFYIYIAVCVAVWAFCRFIVVL
ncbi:hypothetical protein TUM17377_13110 [Shewanella chilikensis]|nr:hypothetical protein TUM17377_13110 [Shewanella chilikensis]